MTREELEAAHCWEADDSVPGRPAMTAFRRALRLHQARWREAHGHPPGTSPIAPRPGQKQRLVGSRLPLDYARETGAAFLGPAAREAARARTASVQRHQSIDHQRIWADLLWSPALAFNLFADADVDAILGAWFPDAPGPVREVRYSYSPGWLDPAYLGSLRSFDAVLLLDGGIVAIDVKYHDRAKPEIPKPENLRRYREVAGRSGVFATTEPVEGRSELCVMWLEHLLLHSMLQHPDGEWRWGRYVVVHPVGNVDAAGMVARYRALLADDSTYAVRPLEPLLATPALRDRYLPDD